MGIGQRYMVMRSEAPDHSQSDYPVSWGMVRKVAEAERDWLERHLPRPEPLGYYVTEDTGIASHPTRHQVFRRSLRWRLSDDVAEKIAAHAQQYRNDPQYVGERFGYDRRNGALVPKRRIEGVTESARYVIVRIEPRVPLTPDAVQRIAYAQWPMPKYVAHWDDGTGVGQY